MSQILKKPVLFVLAIPTLSSLLAWQQKEQGLQPQEKYEVEVRLIPVDVIATKNGEFFPGLKKEDFELFEDGIKVPINSCDLISLGTSALKLTEQKAPIVPDIKNGLLSSLMESMPGTENSRKRPRRSRKSLPPLPRAEWTS
jgi:hypothetical protein